MRTNLIDFISKPIDLRPIGIYRIGLGLIIMVSIIAWVPHLNELFSNEGFHIGPLSSWAPSPKGCIILTVILSISTLLMTIGAVTRMATLVTLLILTFLYGIDSINERALSSIILVNLFIGLLSPWGEFYSVSRWRRRQGNVPVRKSLGNPLALRLWQLQLLQMYFFAGIMKTSYPDWYDGRVLNQIFMGRWSRECGLWLSEIMPASFYPLLSISSFIFEIILPGLLMWPKSRRIGVVLGVLFHLSIETTLYIEFLGFHSMLCLVLFFWPRAIEKQ